MILLQMHETPAQTAASSLTLRSLILGIAVVTIVCLGTPFGNWVLGSSELTWSYFPIGVGFPFVCILFLHILLKSINRSWALRPAELITIVAMGLVVTRVPNFLCGYLLAITTTPYYFASAENQWGEYVVPNLPGWLLPSNAGQAMTWFFEGLPPGEPVPWSTLLAAWVPPLFWWLSFLWTLFFVTFCLVVILRKQWVERERLDFPLMEVPQALIADADGPARVPAILRTRLFWLGASVPLFVVFWNIFGFFFHYVPQIDCDYPVQIARGFPSLNIRLYFPVIGFLYFAKLNVSFSLWFFFTICLIEEGLFNRFGLGVTESDAFVFGLPSTSWQCWGAFVVMVLWGLWMARSRQVLSGSWPLSGRGAYRASGHHPIGHPGRGLLSDHARSVPGYDHGNLWHQRHFFLGLGFPGVVLFILWRRTIAFHAICGPRRKTARRHPHDPTRSGSGRTPGCCPGFYPRPLFHSLQRLRPRCFQLQFVDLSGFFWCWSADL